MRHTTLGRSQLFPQSHVHSIILSLSHTHAYLFVQGDEDHEPDAETHGRRLLERLPERAVLQQLRHDARARDVDEAAGRERRDPRRVGVARALHEQPDNRADHRADRREQLREHGLAAREARLDQDREVADLVRQLVQQHRHRRGPAATAQKGRADRQSVREVVRKVGREVQVPGRHDRLLGVAVVVVIVLVMVVVMRNVDQLLLRHLALAGGRGVRWVRLLGVAGAVRVPVATTAVRVTVAARLRAHKLLEHEERHHARDRPEPHAQVFQAVRVVALLAMVVVVMAVIMSVVMSVVVAVRDRVRQQVQQRVAEQTAGREAQKHAQQRLLRLLAADTQRHEQQHEHRRGADERSREERLGPDADREAVCGGSRHRELLARWSGWCRSLGTAGVAVVRMSVIVGMVVVMVMPFMGGSSVSRSAPFQRAVAIVVVVPVVVVIMVVRTVRRVRVMVVVVVAMGSFSGGRHSLRGRLRRGLLHRSMGMSIMVVVMVVTSVRVHKDHAGDRTQQQKQQRPRSSLRHSPSLSNKHGCAVGTSWAADFCALPCWSFPSPQQQSTRRLDDEGERFNSQTTVLRICMYLSTCIS